MKNLKTKDLDKTMKIVLEKCDNDKNYWHGDSLNAFCETEKNKNSLYVLNEKGYLSLIFGKKNHIVFVNLNNLSSYYFAEKQNKNRDFVKSFFSQFLTGFLSGLSVSLVIGLLSQIIKNQ